MPSIYPTIVPWIQDCLQERANGLEDTYFDRHISSVLRDMLPQGVSYAGLSAGDKQAVDEAAGYRTAVRVHGSLVTGGVSTFLRSEKSGFSDRDFGDPETLKAEWEALATKALRKTSFGSSIPTFSTSAVNGPSRERCRNRCSDRYPYHR